MKPDTYLFNQILSLLLSAHVTTFSVSILYLSNDTLKTILAFHMIWLERLPFFVVVVILDLVTM